MKGIEHFIEVAKKIRNRRQYAKFIHVGAEVVNSQGFIESSGKISHNDMVSYYQKAMCVCIPTLFMETSCIAALEAMACAKPVVSYAVGGLMEIVKDYKTGFHVRRGNIAELTEKVLWLLHNEDTAKDMGLNARKHVEKHFTLEKMSDEYEELYNTMRASTMSYL